MYTHIYLPCSFFSWSHLISSHLWRNRGVCCISDTHTTKPTNFWKEDTYFFSSHLFSQKIFIPGPNSLLFHSACQHGYYVINMKHNMLPHFKNVQESEICCCLVKSPRWGESSKLSLSYIHHFIAPVEKLMAFPSVTFRRNWPPRRLWQYTSWTEVKWSPCLKDWAAPVGCRDEWWTTTRPYRARPGTCPMQMKWNIIFSFQ